MRHFAYLRGLAAATIALISLTCSAWSQKGHDVTAYIAEKHLTPRTAAAVDSLLQGMSMVYWANWLDNASHTPEYAYSKTWHYNNVDANETYDTRRPAPDGDAITALRHTIGVLAGDRQWPQGSPELALKMLIHIMADIHQPLHQLPTAHRLTFRHLHRGVDIAAAENKHRTQNQYQYLFHTPPSFFLIIPYRRFAFMNKLQSISYKKEKQPLL